MCSAALRQQGGGLDFGGVLSFEMPDKSRDELRVRSKPPRLQDEAIRQFALASLQWKDDTLGTVSAVLFCVLPFWLSVASVQSRPETEFKEKSNSASEWQV